MRIKKALAAGTLLAVTTVLVPVVAASTASAAAKPLLGFPCQGAGTGSTPQAALAAAERAMFGDVTTGIWVYSSGQNADGSYWELITARCTSVSQ
jgi:hypothetical protein